MLWDKALQTARRWLDRVPESETGRPNVFMQVKSAMLSDKGGREENEDDAGIVEPNDPAEIDKKGNLYIVADGVGGRVAGEVASQTAVEIISHEYYVQDAADIEASLRSAFKAANRRIYEMASQEERGGMGTTCACAVLRGKDLYVAHVGDSRVYLYHNEKMIQLTEDHSRVAELVKIGALTPEQARTSPYKHVITRCLGTAPDVEVDTRRWEIAPGDILVLCTDGLYNQISEGELATTIVTFPPEEACQRLVQLANRGDGSDNVTVIVVKVEGAP